MANTPLNMAAGLPTRHSLLDSTLLARLEGMKLLADGLSQCVAVLAPDLRIVYANEPTWARTIHDASRPCTYKCHEILAQRPHPCEICPARAAFEMPPGSLVFDTARSAHLPCGLRQAIPLFSAGGMTELVLALFEPPTLEGQWERAEAPDDRPASRMVELIGQSEVMRELFEMIRMMADSQATVLIEGESGTGKELVAKTIHASSPRRDHPFVVVDCGSLPETLLESELFGHVKGAFTGAICSRKGLFEEAEGGTLFLDEVADTTPQFQAKLLRVLQEGEIKPVGSSRRIKVNVRIISATNKRLEDLIKAGAFRQDLYYRLAVLPVYVPPLRDRREDIPLLISHFLVSSCRRHHRTVSTVTRETMQHLVERPWPGNVRELQHVIERAVVTTAGNALIVENALRDSAGSAAEDLRTIARDATRQVERRHILEALLRTAGNRSKAARLLKISRANLYNKLRIYQID